MQLNGLMKTLSLAILLVVAIATGSVANVPTEMRDAADDFLASLDEDQRELAQLGFEDDERENFRFTPRPRAGISLKDMNEAQREKANALLGSALSEKGLLKVEQIILLEAFLGEVSGRPDFRDPERYFVAVFGKPDAGEAWGWRFEGHHLSLNFTIVGEDVAVTPSFMGANPAEVPSGEHKGLRVLGAEEDLARALVHALIAGDKEGAVFSDHAPREILTAEQRVVTALDPVGIAAGDMSEAQQQALRKLIDEYLSRHRAVLAEADWKAIEDAGFDKILFGWAGGTDVGEAYYYRIQGPTFLMEVANTQNNANHLHATWRDLKNDFGRDILGEHYRAHED